MRLNFYDVADLEHIVQRGARILGVELAADGATEIARRSRGTPRIATRLLRRVRDFAAVDGKQRNRRRRRPTRRFSALKSTAWVLTNSIGATWS